MLGNKIELNGCRLRDISPSDLNFLCRLFQVDDVNLYYVRRNDHQDTRVFLDYMISQQSAHRAIEEVIERQDGLPMGIITAEVYRTSQGEVAWNIGYAMLPEYRGNGYMTTALNALVYNLKQFQINTAILDISDDNTDSIRVASACGFCCNRQMSFIDSEHPEIGVRNHYKKTLHETNMREVYFQKGFIAYQQGNYQLSVDSFTEALKHPFTVGSPLSDAQIYSNLGFAHSSLNNYRIAYDYLNKAAQMGLMNASMQKEMIWLSSRI